MDAFYGENVTVNESTTHLPELFLFIVGDQLRIGVRWDRQGYKGK